MTKPRFFFITGHQRSRTAWLANLFNTEDVFCHHDASRSMPNPPQLEEVVNGKASPEANFIGDSDNGLPVFPAALEWFWKNDRDVPVAIVWRPENEVLKSLQRAYGQLLTDEQILRSVEVSRRGLETIRDSGLNVREYDFHRLNEMAVLADMSNFLLGKEIDMVRAGYLRMLNVQLQEPQYSMGFSKAFHAYVKNLIGGA